MFRSFTKRLEESMADKALGYPACIERSNMSIYFETSEKFFRTAPTAQTMKDPLRISLKNVNKSPVSYDMIQYDNLIQL